MNNEEARKIVNKCILVITSCKTKDQLPAASNYAALAYRLLAKEIGLINNMDFITLIERSIGYAQCNVGNKPFVKLKGKHKRSVTINI